MTIEPQTGYSDYPVTQEARFHLIGGGISSLAAAVFLIRDGKIAGRNITRFKCQPKPEAALKGPVRPRQAISPAAAGCLRPITSAP